jgi:hypothetical protein
VDDNQIVFETFWADAADLAGGPWSLWASPEVADGPYQTACELEGQDDGGAEATSTRTTCSTLHDDCRILPGGNNRGELRET